MQHMKPISFQLSKLQTKMLSSQWVSDISLLSRYLIIFSKCWIHLFKLFRSAHIGLFDYEPVTISSPLYQSHLLAWLPNACKCRKKRTCKFDTWPPNRVSSSDKVILWVSLKESVGRSIPPGLTICNNIWRVASDVKINYPSLYLAMC